MGNHSRNLYSILIDVEKIEGEKHKLSNIFAEILKDEINALDEQQIYNGLRNLIDQYKDDENALKLIDETFEALCDGATLSEIFLIARDEMEYPTPTNVMNLDEFNRLEH